jgi:nicotinate-nucleotide adenylyltransferase
MAIFAREQLELDQVFFIPAAAPPHKDATVAPYQFRIGLLRLVAVRHPWMVVSDLESDPSSPSYTIDTLRRLRSSLEKDDTLWLLIGADSLKDLPTWKDPREIVRLTRLAVYGRPGHEPTVPAGVEVDWIGGPLCGISSTLIRARLALRLSVERMVPGEVIARIESADYYRTGDNDA